MSAGIVGKDGAGYAKKDVAESRQLVMGYKTVVAAHKSPGNETGINLLSMVAPGGDLPGFQQPNASEIQAARPYMQPGTLKIRSSARGQLIMFAHFVMVGNQVVFTSDFGTSLVNELFIIEITPIPANNLMVSDARQFDTGVFSQAVGQATVNVGYVFTASDFLVVIRNNAVLDEGTDYTRVIGSSGSGSTLLLAVAPSGVADSMRVYGGIFFGNGSVEMFTQLERMQAAIAALATDAAAGFYGDNNVARYLSMTPTELDRQVFGNIVYSLLNAQVPWITPWANFTPTVNNGGSFTIAEQFQWRRNMGQLQIRGRIDWTGAGGAGIFSINQPTGLGVNPDSLYSAGFATTYAIASDVGFSVAGISTTNGQFFIFDNDTGSNLSGSNISSGDIISFTIDARVSGWAETRTLKEQLGL